MSTSPVILAESILPLPRGEGAWGLLALVILILTVSSVAPFVQLEPGGPSVGPHDLASALAYIATWIPFFALVAFLTGRHWLRESLAHWTAHLVFLLTLPAVHSVTFVELVDWLEPRFAGTDGLADARIGVLTLLGTLQYLVVVSLFLAVFAGRAAGRARLRAARLEGSRTGTTPRGPAGGRPYSNRRGARGGENRALTAGVADRGACSASDPRAPRRPGYPRQSLRD